MTIQIITETLSEINLKGVKNAKDTNTTGKYSFVVATLVGGVMEMPDWECHDYQIIHADTSEEAVIKYNTLNDCRYYYGHTICRIFDNEEVKHA